MAYKKGEGGRPKGASNHLTKTVRESVLHVFNELQADDKNNLLAFAKKYPRDFYLIAAKLIPMELTGIGGKDLIPQTLTFVSAKDLSEKQFKLLLAPISNSDVNSDNPSI